MTLRIYLGSISLTWLTAIGGHLLIQHGWLVWGLLVVLAYCIAILATAFKIETLEDERFRLIGADEKPGPRQEWE